jgi:hypothetical protein
MKSKGQQRRISTQVGHLPRNDGQLLVEGLATRWLADSTHTGPLPRATKTRTIGPAASSWLCSRLRSPFVGTQSTGCLTKETRTTCCCWSSQRRGRFQSRAIWPVEHPKRKSHQEGGGERGRPLSFKLPFGVRAARETHCTRT